MAVNLKTGKDASGHISLRSAVMAANAHGGPDKIVLPVGTFLLTIPGADEQAAATGDLDINGNLTISGKGAGSTAIDGNHLDRVIEVLGGTVSISELTIRNGRAVAAGGGGFLNDGGKVTLTSVSVINNASVGLDAFDGLDGANGLDGGLGGSGTAGQGGGIFNADGSLSLVKSTVSSNLAIGGAGGNGGQGSFVAGSIGAGRSQRHRRPRRRRRPWRHRGRRPGRRNLQLPGREAEHLGLHPVPEQGPGRERRCRRLRWDSALGGQGGAAASPLPGTAAPGAAATAVPAGMRAELSGADFSTRDRSRFRVTEAA